jgi:hypothetical protein
MPQGNHNGTTNEVAVNQESKSLKQNAYQDRQPRLRSRLFVVGVVTLATVLAMAVVPPIPQNAAYHDFADRRELLGVPNFLNVISNLGFLLAGGLGLFFVAGPGARNRFLHQSERWPYVIFFIGVALTFVGSAYYHLVPSNQRLMWDRLPMSIAFVSLLSACIAERINLKIGLAALPFLLLVGTGSVVYWRLSEQSGTGDLRLYILVQFYSALAIAMVTALFPATYTRGGELALAILFYAVAKVFELLDSQVYNLTGIVSGHTLKHFTAAVSVWFILHMLKHRSPRSDYPELNSAAAA